MVKATKDGILNRADGLVTEFLSQLKDGGRDFLNEVKTTGPISSIMEMLKKNNGRIEPVLEHLRTAKDSAHDAVRENPQVAAIATALVLRAMKHESWPRALANAVSLRNIFKGNAGLASKIVIALEGRDGGAAAATYIEDIAGAVATKLSKLNEVDVSAAVETALENYDPSESVRFDQRSWKFNKAEMDEIRNRLAEKGFNVVSFVKVAAPDSAVRKVGGVAGFAAAFSLADKVSKSMNAAVTPIAPAPLMPA